MKTSLKKTLLPAALGVAAALGAAACGGAGPANHSVHLTTFHPTATGTLEGSFFTEGGLAPGDIKYPLSGTVTLTPKHGYVITAKIGKDGEFSVVVPVGSYTVRATPLRWEGNTTVTASTSVTANDTSAVTLGIYLP